MANQHSIARLITVMSAALFLTLAAGCSKQDEPNNLNAEPTQDQRVSVQLGKAASKLGDLSAFHSIAKDVATIVNEGDLLAAKNRIKDLEVAWDSAEAGLKPRAANDWHVLDKTIDKSLATFRSDTPNQADCKAVMTTLLNTFDSLEGKKTDQ